MNKRALIITAVSVIAFASAGLVYASSKQDQEAEPVNSTSVASETSNTTPVDDTVKEPSTDSSDASEIAGRYVDYSESLVAETGFDTTILFFHAPWCPDCRAFDKSISSAQIPDSTQILKVDYDSSKDLRQRYGVTVQTTFVSVDSAGEAKQKWVGYGKETTLDAVLENTA